MWRLPSIFAFIGMVSLCLNFQSSEAIAQTTEPTATPLLDLTLPPEWEPGDGRPPWSNAPTPTSAPTSSWQPGDGQPPWAVAPDNLLTNDQLTGRPDWAGRPMWADRPDEPQGLRDQRRFEASSLQSLRGGVARGTGNRGRGRK